LHIGNESYTINVKVATDQHGTVLNVAAEFDEATALARRLNIPVKRVMRMAEQEAWNRVGG
jgi:uncharacterized protein (DUF111 family)